MIGRSLRGRLLLTGAATLAASLGLAALGLDYLFERHVERVAVADLEARALAVAAMVEPRGAAGAAFRPSLVDPLYNRPFSGHYWQVELGSELHRSRSLWDYTLPVATSGVAVGETRVFATAGPRAEPLLAVEQRLEVGAGAAALPLRIVVAADRQDLDRARREFLADLMPYLGLLGVLLLAASWMQISVGLRPMSQISARVAALRSGRMRRIGHDVPAEVLPLAGEIDELLDARAAELGRARHRAADLAHGFKTPLQALFGDAAQLRERGETETAESIERVATVMRRIVDRELMRSRIQSERSNAEVDPAPIVARVVEVLRRTPAGGAIDWQIDVEPGTSVRIDPDDLTEALGALLENATRHAAGEVSVTVLRTGTFVEIRIGDDGPGVADQDLAHLSRRGFRLDEAGEGQGIGLALVADIVASARGVLSLRNLRPGLEVTLRLEGGSSRPGAMVHPAG